MYLQLGKINSAKRAYLCHSHCYISYRKLLTQVLTFEVLLTVHSHHDQGKLLSFISAHISSEKFLATCD